MASLDRWHPIRLTDPSILDHINDYLSNGWYLEHFDLEGLPYPIFDIPTRLIPPGERRLEEMLDLRKEGETPISLMVLRYGAEGIQQKAVLLEQNAEGKFVLPVPSQGWNPIVLLKFESGGMLGVYQRRDALR